MSPSLAGHLKGSRFDPSYAKAADLGSGAGLEAPGVAVTCGDKIFGHAPIGWIRAFGPE